MVSTRSFPCDGMLALAQGPPLRLCVDQTEFISVAYGSSPI